MTGEWTCCGRVVQMKDLVDELFPSTDFDRLQSGMRAIAQQQQQQQGDAALPEAACQRAKRKTMDINVDASSAPSPSEQPEGAPPGVPNYSNQYTKRIMISQSAHAREPEGKQKLAVNYG